METEEPEAQATQELTIHVIRTLFVVISASLGWEIARKFSDVSNWYHPQNLIGLAIGLMIGLSMVAAEVKLSKRFAANLFTVVIGIGIGFIGSYLFFQGLLLIPHINVLEQEQQNVLKLFITLVFCYLAIVVVFQGKDQFKLIIPFVESEKSGGGPRPWLLDTSVIIDGRIESVLAALKVDGPIRVPQFVLDEMQTLADSRDKLKRQRGRRGLDLLASLKNNRQLTIEIDEATIGPGEEVDAALLAMARSTGSRVVSNDNALRKIGQLQGVDVISIHELADALKSVVLPGEELCVRLVKPGEQPHQGLGFMEDGTMVVVERSVEHIGETVTTTVTSVLQTQNGRMIFSKLSNNHGK